MQHHKKNKITKNTHKSPMPHDFPVDHIGIGNPNPVGSGDVSEFSTAVVSPPRWFWHIWNRRFSQGHGHQQPMDLFLTDLTTSLLLLQVAVLKDTRGWVYTLMYCVYDIVWWRKIVDFMCTNGLKHAWKNFKESPKRRFDGDLHPIAQSKKSPPQRITGPCYKGFGMCIAGFWDLQTTSFEIPWFLGPTKSLTWST